MILFSLQKVRLTGLSPHYERILEEVSRRGILEIVRTPELIASSTYGAKTLPVCDARRVDFALKFLSTWQPRRKFLFFGKPPLPANESAPKLLDFHQAESLLDETKSLDEKLVLLQRDFRRIALCQKFLTPFKIMRTPVQKNYLTERTRTWIGFLPKKFKKSCVESLAGESNLVDIQFLSTQKGRRLPLRVTATLELISRTAEILDEHEFAETDFSHDFASFFGRTPREILFLLEKEQKLKKNEENRLHERARELSRELSKLKIFAEENAWCSRCNDLRYDILSTRHIFAFEGWMPQKSVDPLRAWLENTFSGEVLLENIEPAPNEEAPTTVSFFYFLKKLFQREVRKFQPFVRSQKLHYNVRTL